MSSSAKAFLQKNKEKRSKENISKYSGWADENLEAIQQLLRTHRSADHTEMYQSILNYLKAAETLSATKLELPAMTPSLLSSLLSNMAYWIGNTAMVKKLQEEIFKKE